MSEPIFTSYMICNWNSSPHSLFFWEVQATSWPNFSLHVDLLPPMVRARTLPMNLQRKMRPANLFSTAVEINAATILIQAFLLHLLEQHQCVEPDKVGQLSNRIFPTLS